jgi:hypothetical protein
MSAPVPLPGEVVIGCTPRFTERFISDADYRRECLLATGQDINALFGRHIRKVYVKRISRPRRKPERGGATAYRHAAE